jgi:flagellar protein FlaJ
MFIEKYKKFCYHYLGKRLDDKNFFNSFNQNLRQANINFSAGFYLSLAIVTALLLVIVSFFLYTVIFKMIIDSSNWMIYTGILSLITSLFPFFIFFYYLRLKISNRKMQINKDLPFALSKMSILASTGISPVEIIRWMAKGKDSIAQEFERIVYRLDIEGMDIVTALGKMARETPSDAFRESLWDLSNMIHTGGNLDDYLRKKADQTMELKRDVQKEFIEKLSTYAEMYLSLVVMGVLLGGVAVFLIDAMNTSLLGMDGATILSLLAYGVVPLAIFIMSLLVSMMYSTTG